MEKKNELKKNDVKEEVAFTVGDKKKKGSVLDVCMLVLSKSLSIKLRKMAKDERKEIADIAESIIINWFAIKQKEIEKKRNNEKKMEKRNILLNDLDKGIVSIKKNIGLLKRYK